MEASLMVDGKIGRRILLFVSGLGMIVASILTIRHFFRANYPQSIFQGSFCDINAFFNCDSSAFSSISQIHGVPLGYFGLMVGVLVALCAVFPSPAFERTNKTISALNAAGVAAQHANYPSLVHDFFIMGDVSPAVTEAAKEAGAAVKAALG